MATHETVYSRKHINLEGLDVVAFMANGDQVFHVEDGSESCSSCTGATEAFNDDCVSCTSCTGDTEAAV